MGKLPRPVTLDGDRFESLTPWVLMRGNVVGKLNGNRHYENDTLQTSIQFSRTTGGVPEKENAIASATILAEPVRLTPLALWHLLSLDAPTVAVIWLCFVSRATHTPLPSTLPAAMFLAVWLIYAADRLLDTHRPEHALQTRHLFARTHLLPFAFAMLIASPALAILIRTLPAGLLGPYLLLAALLLAWFSLIHLTRLPLPKELVPGIFFAAAIFLPLHTGLLPPILFASLCTLNCLYIHAWEHPQNIPESPSRVPHPHDSLTVVRVGLGRRPTAPARRSTELAHIGPATNPHPATRLALRHLSQLTLAVALLPLARLSPIAIATSLSALALFALDYYRNNLSPTTLRAAADLALLTPILILPFLP